MLQDAVKLLLEEFPLKSDVPGGMPEYRRSLVVSFFFKFFWRVKSQLPGRCVGIEIAHYSSTVCHIFLCWLLIWQCLTHCYICNLVILTSSASKLSGVTKGPSWI